MIVLASQSPRRKEIMEQVGLSFIVCPSQSEERLDTALPLTEAIEQVAMAKANDVVSLYPQDIVVGADTLVCMDEQVLGKP